jgi:myo-inositol-1(or 4)-monophosphatase
MPPEFLAVCLDAAQRAGGVLLDWKDRFQPREKGPKDLVTQADLAAQEAIRECIHKSLQEHEFLSEEDAAERKANGLPPILDRRSDFRWIVDPLDGTTNYVHRLPGYAVSIALQRGAHSLPSVVKGPRSTASRSRPAVVRSSTGPSWPLVFHPTSREIRPKSPALSRSFSPPNPSDEWAPPL